MKETLLMMLFRSIVAFVSEDILKSLAAKLIAWCRETILGTKTKLDDALFLPLLDKIQEAFGIPESELPEIDTD